MGVDCCRTGGCEYPLFAHAFLGNSILPERKDALFSYAGPTEIDMTITGVETSEEVADRYRTAGHTVELT